ncbi:MAG: hypothetical protein V1681_01495 [Candidatus Neomarinimicrobiota bacterium]
MNWWYVIIQTVINGLLFVLIIELFKHKFQIKEDLYKNELTIIHTTFSNNYSLIIDFYSSFYKHYRLCQRVTNHDIVTYLDGKTESLRQIFLKTIDTNIEEIKKYDPKIRLILPKRISEIYDKCLIAFNDLRDIIIEYKDTPDLPKGEMKKTFIRIDELKSLLEKELQNYLRIEKLYAD